MNDFNLVACMFRSLCWRWCLSEKINKYWNWSLVCHPRCVHLSTLLRFKWFVFVCACFQCRNIFVHIAVVPINICRTAFTPTVTHRPTTPNIQSQLRVVWFWSYSWMRVWSRLSLFFVSFFTCRCNGVVDITDKNTKTTPTHRNCTDIYILITIHWHVYIDSS